MHVEKHLKICIKSDLKEMFLKLATNGESDKAFLLASNFCLPLCRGYMHVEKHKKMCIKSRVQRNVFETYTKWAK